MIHRGIFLLFLAFNLFAQQDSVYLAEHLAMGNPSNASVSLLAPDNYLMAKKQYVLSYNRFFGTANWVAWHTDSTWLGDIHRQNDFRADSMLPANWYHVHQYSYRRSGYDRGHMCPSGDRTNTAEDNSLTFLMTNMIPQAPNNNRGPWAQFEIYCRDLVKQGKELYIYSGGFGEQGYLDSGRVKIPAYTWKAVLVLDAGENDLQRVTDSTRTIGVIMPNSNSRISIGNNWKSFRVSIDEIEKKTGFNLFPNLPADIQKRIEHVIDKN
ncbi:MAG: DNA/RNA non-specific endonuclease [Bacteroidetes bacterium]|nr:DNA/RNA non-specific endonuclease [Bacteroidota bacterium]